MIYIACQSSSGSAETVANLSKFWNITRGAVETIALLNEIEATTPYSLVSDLEIGQFRNLFPANDGDTSGDAAWVDEAAILREAFIFREDPILTRKLAGGTPGEQTTIEFYGSTDGSARSATVTVNGGTPINLPQHDGAGGPNLSQTAVVEATWDVNGEITMVFEGEPSANSYLQAIRFGTPDADPSLTITNEAAITPGTTLTATASNFAAAPTTISLSDGASPALTPALTATASGDDYDLSALIADFKAQADSAGEGVAVQGLRIGTITATVE